MKWTGYLVTALGFLTVGKLVASVIRQDELLQVGNIQKVDTSMMLMDIAPVFAIFCVSIALHYIFNDER